MFDQTAEHEKRRAEDADYIAYLGNAYRFGVDWARLQSAANAPFDPQVVEEYKVCYFICFYLIFLF